MFDKFTAPFVPLITESIKAPSDHISNVFVSTSWAGTNILALLTFIAFTVAISFLLRKGLREKGAGIFILAAASTCLLMNNAIIYKTFDGASDEQIKSQLSQAYIDAGMVDFALEVNPHFLPQNAKELALLENYKGKNNQPFQVLIQAYIIGTDGVARDLEKALLMDHKLKKRQELQAFSGDVNAFIYIAKDMTMPVFQKALDSMPKNCYNADKLSTARKYSIAITDKQDVVKNDKIFEWLKFTKTECIPVWNSLTSPQEYTAPTLQ